MLTQLTIKNFGLIDETSLPFDPRLNVLTGETGAGKSIIIDGLRFALGERLKTSQIRDTDAPCVVEAVFQLNQALVAQHDVFREFVNAEDFLLVIYREASADGRTKIKVNGMTVTVAQLKVLGNHLMDFHGPHDHQMLLAEEQHLMMLDRLIDFRDLKNSYEENFKRYVNLTVRLNELRSLASSRDRELDLITHQIKELEQVPLDQEKYEELLRQQARLSNTERLAQAASSLIDLFEQENVGVSDHIRKAFGFVRALTETDASTAAMEQYLTTIQDQSDQLIAELKQYSDGLAFEPGEAERISRQYDIYEDIKRKYGPLLEDARQFYEQIKHKYELLVDLEHNDEELKKEIAASEKTLKEIALAMSKERRAAAKNLEKTIEQELRDLGIEHVDFEVRFEDVPFHKEGIDRVVFYISPNAGESLKPLAEIVSSGEAARLMLALKKALTKVDPIPVLIFDEIDSQIGGRLGTMTGRKLKELSCDRQVILITHLPQIAVFGNQHLKVNKVVKKKRTYTEVAILKGDDRVNELAQMMDGQKQSDLTVEHAREMLKRAK